MFSWKVPQLFCLVGVTWKSKNFELCIKSDSGKIALWLCGCVSSQELKKGPHLHCLFSLLFICMLNPPLCMWLVLSSLHLAKFVSVVSALWLMCAKLVYQAFNCSSYPLCKFQIPGTVRHPGLPQKKRIYCSLPELLWNVSPSTLCWCIWMFSLWYVCCTMGSLSIANQAIGPTRL